ncbi:carbohydrate ABC transporter permease [Inquilinus limosus]|uniref:carbohydrate ABC transporter permease n=1 Tax=Inquilinus limosus TaxID=171674 RepID=UPI0009DBFC1E|nr:carbohydrate ABC transporter permease [Inquilinus limosus]
MTRPALPLARMRRALGPLLGHLVLIAAAALVLLPFAWMVLTALRPPADVLSEPFGLPTDAAAAIDNVRQAVTAVPMLRLLLNGLIVVGGIVAAQLLVAIPCAYALAKLRFPGRRLLFALVLLALCIPVQVPMLPLYLGLARLHLLDSYAALMLPFLLSVFAIFLLRQHFRGYPDAVLEAARLDGLTLLEILLRLVVPSARPAIAAFVVFSATAHWNDLFWPMIVVSSTDMATPPLGLLFFRDGELGANYGALMAAALIVTAPLVAAFFAAQRQFIRGIAMTGLR